MVSMEGQHDDRDASSEHRQFGEIFSENFKNDEGNFLSSEKRFDASQYAFFGRDVTQEVEIGGLEEEDYIEQLHVADDEEEAFCVVEKGELHRSTSRVNGETELSKSREGGRKPIIEASIDLSPAFEPGCVNSFDHKQDAPAEQGRNECCRHLHPKAVHELDADSSLVPIPPQTHETQRWASERSLMPNLPPPVPSYMAQRTQQATSTVQNQGSQVQSDQLPGGLLPTRFRIPHPNLQSPAEVLSSIPSYGCSSPPQCSSGEVKSFLTPAELWSAQSTEQLGGLAIPGPQGLPSSSSLLPAQVVLQCHIPHFSRFRAVPGPSYSPYNPQATCHSRPLVPQLQGRRGHGTASEESREVLALRGRQALRPTSHRVVDESVLVRNSHLNGWQALRSKYMTVEEIENIVKIQWAATHSSDPYVDDYYHQSVQTKLAAGLPGGAHFFPSRLRDLPSHTRAAVEPHAYLQVDALGRVPFSSIHRPRPLLEVDSGIGSGELSGSSRQSDGMMEVVPLDKPLEKEPMLAARIAIEDGFCLLLDVDDIDRLLMSTQYPDGGAQLMRRRQLLVETLAASLQLVDPEDESAPVYGAKETYTLPFKQDTLLLRLVTLSKGRKFLTRYMKLLPPGSELVQIVTVALLQHLRFLFGGAPSDTNTFVTIDSLANTVAASVMDLDLPALSACLASVLLAPEQPPLRPMGCPGGDGATIVLKAVLERATHLLTDPSAGYSLQNRAVWQASFDAFFTLLIKYCTNKYDSIFHSLMVITPGNPGAVKAAAALSMNKELPVEILRASLPHTSDHQRKFLLEFTRGSTAISTLPT